MLALNCGGELVGGRVGVWGGGRRVEEGILIN